MQINSTTEQYLNRVGRRIRGLRERRGLTRQALARESGVSERYLAQIELGRGNISIALLRDIAAALHTDPGELLRLHELDSAEHILIADLLRELSAEQRQAALQLLFDRFAPPGGIRRRIALVGLRGAGKTTLGSLLAERLGVPFVQMVSEIERIGGMSVSEIFSLSGRAGYRRLEERALIEIINSGEHCVIETSGSIVADARLYQVLLTSCFVVWIKARPDEHMQRVIEQGDLRPITDRRDAMADLKQILSERDPLYAQAHTTLDTSGKDIDSCLSELLQLLPEDEQAPPASALSSLTGARR